VLLLDVTPLSLGIETLGSVSTKLIERNTTIPVRKSEIFSTAADNQTSVEVHVLQGEREMARDNRTLGRFHLLGIPPAPRGVPQIEVTFDVDANGIVNVSARDLASGKEQAITITSSSGLAKDEVARMVKEAEAHRGDDRRKRQEVEARNRLDNLVYTTERTLKENRERVDAGLAEELDRALSEARQAAESGEPERTRQAEERLTQLSHRLAELLYPKAGAASQAAEDPEIVDAELSEVGK
jgi:molecular chaperone DnaK